MTDTPQTDLETDDDVVVLGSLEPPTSPARLRLVADDDRPATVARVQALPPLPPRRYSPVQWLSFAATLVSIGVLSATIVMFEPPTYLAVAVLVAVVVVGSILICAEAVSVAVNRRHESGDMSPHRRSSVDVITGSLSTGYDVRTLDVD